MFPRLLPSSGAGEGAGAGTDRRESRSGCGGLWCWTWIQPLPRGRKQSSHIQKSYEGRQKLLKIILLTAECWKSPAHPLLQQKKFLKWKYQHSVTFPHLKKKEDMATGSYLKKKIPLRIKSKILCCFEKRQMWSVSIHTHTKKSTLEESFPRAHTRDNNLSLCLSYMLGPSARNFCRGNLESLEVIDPSKGFRGQECFSNSS